MEIAQEIRALKKARDAVILAHPASIAAIAKMIDALV